MRLKALGRVVFLLGACALFITVGPACAVCPSTEAKLGATPYEGGTTFRVWAPNAESVSVAGTFNNWNTTANPLCAEPEGYWSGDLAGVGEGAAYKYVIVNGGRTLWRQDPVGPRLVSSSGNSVVYDHSRFAWSEAPGRVAGPERMVIYEMHIGTFHDPDLQDPAVGTFDAAVAKLPHLADLGVNMVKVLPVAEFPGTHSWGYNPAAPYAVEADYGGPDGFKRFVQACHGHGIGVILDVVYNHLGPGDMALWQYDGWSIDGKGGIYFFQDARADTPWGPRPDFGRPEVSTYIVENALAWLTHYRLDGLRWDATAFIRNIHGNNNDPANDIASGWYLLQSANNLIDTIPRPVINIAEDLRGNAWITKPTSVGGAGFDSQWDGSFVDHVRPSLETGSDDARNMAAVREALAGSFNDDIFERIHYTESHDAVANGNQRVPSKVDLANPGSYWARKRSMLGAALVLTAPGIPMLFQGQEFLEDGWFSDQDPLDWSKTNTYAAVHQAYKDLIALRTNRDQTTRGLTGQGVNVHHVNDKDKVIAFHRWDQGGAGDDVMVIANFANRTWPASENYRVGFPKAGAWKVRYNGDWRRYGPDFGDGGSTQVVAESTPWNGMSESAIVSLAPYSVLILSQ